MEWLRQGLCRHEWEVSRGVGFINEGGCFRPVDLRTCRKCGRVERIIARAEKGDAELWTM